MIWVLVTFGACLVLVFAIGYLVSEGRGDRKYDAGYEAGWEARDGWLAHARPTLPEHGYAPPVSRRLTDAFTHPSGSYRTLPPVLEPVVEPIRTEVLAGYRGRHSTDQPTGRIQRPGEITQALQRILDEAEAVH